MTADLVPYVLGRTAAGARALAARSPLPRTRLLDVLDEATLPFYRLLNAANRMAYGGLGMPPWVQLDCCTLPSAMIGFARPRAEIDDALFAALQEGVRAGFSDEAAAALDGYEGLVPVSEYCALASLEEGAVVGFSFFSLLPGAGLPTKALALLLLAPRTQTGIAQYGNSAVKAHARLGPLEVVAARAPPHSRPDETFVYRLEVPPPGRLEALARGERAPLEEAAPDELVPVEEAASRIEALQRGGARVFLVAPGHVVSGGRKHVALRIGIG